jgi:hypothetical protein
VEAGLALKASVQRLEFFEFLLYSRVGFLSCI